MRVRDWVERRLKGAAYARAAVAESFPSLAPPLKKIFSHTDREMGAPLPVSGAVPSAAANLLIMNYGTGAKAFDLDKRAEPLRLTESIVQLAAFVEDGLVLAEPGAVTRVDLAVRKREWRLETPTRMRGFAFSGPFLFYLALSTAEREVLRHRAKA